MQSEVIRGLEFARGAAGFPFKINSGSRCEKHNKEVGGKPNSAHLSGLAADIDCRYSTVRWTLLNALIKVGFMRLEIGPTWIHADMDYSKVHPAIFLV
jgi:hypothetical protein